MAVSCPVIDVSGSPYERGHAYGVATRGLIERGVDTWHESLKGVAGGDVDAYLARFLQDTDFVTAIEKWTPEVLAEIDGIADGSGIDYHTMLTYQFMDEQWCYEHRKVLAASDVHHCSGVSAPRAGGGRIVAQNMDLPRHFDGTQVVVRSPSEMAFTAAGLTVATGMNAAGVGVCVNSIMDRPTAPTGLPVAFVIRGVLSKTNAADAAAFVREVDHASGQNYLIADATQTIDIEAASDGTIDFDAGGDVTTHTNHSVARASGEALETYATRHSMDFSGLQNSHARQSFLVDAFAGRKDVTEDDVQAALSDMTVPICRIRRDDTPWMTFGSVVMTLTDQPQMHLAPGPPDTTAYVAHAFR